MASAVTSLPIFCNKGIIILREDFVLSLLSMLFTVIIDLIQYIYIYIYFAVWLAQLVKALASPMHVHSCVQEVIPRAINLS